MQGRHGWARCIVGIGVLVVAGHLPMPFARAATESHSFVQTSDQDADRSKNRLYDFQAMKMIKDKLDGFYDDLQVVVSSCLSGGFAAEAEKRLTDTTKYSVTTSRDMKKSEEYVWNTKATEGGKTGFNYVNDRYMHGWQGQWAKKLFETPTATAQELYDYAKTNDFDEDRTTSMITGKNDGKSSKAFLGARSRAGLWYSLTDGGEGSYAVYKALKGTGYTDATIDFAYQRSSNGDTLGGVGSPPTPEFPIDRMSTKAGFGVMLDNIKNGITGAGSDPRKALIMLGAHGNVEKVDPEKLVGAIPNAPNQGRTFLPGNATTTLALDQDFLDTFFLDVAPGPTVDDFIRTGQPSIRLSTVFESAPMIVQVLLDGVDVGEMNLNGSGAGGSYAIDIDDADLLTLYNSGALNDFTANVSFEFGTGSFQIATDYDFDLGLSDAYGVGLAAPPIMGVPEPATALAAFAALALLCRGRPANN